MAAPAPAASFSFGAPPFTFEFSAPPPPSIGGAAAAFTFGAPPPPSGGGAAAAPAAPAAQESAASPLLTLTQSSRTVCSDSSLSSKQTLPVVLFMTKRPLPVKALGLTDLVELRAPFHGPTNPFVGHVRYFELAGLCDRFIFRVASNYGNDATSRWFEGALDAADAWPLLRDAFAAGDHVSVSGWVHAPTSAPSEGDVRAALARAAAGERVVIPAAVASRYMVVTAVAVHKARADGGAGGVRGAPVGFRRHVRTVR